MDGDNRAMSRNNNPPTYKLRSFGTEGAKVLGAKVVATAKEEVEIPAVLAKAVSKVNRLHQRLVRATRVRKDDALTRKQREAQREEVVAWTAFRRSVESWKMLRAKDFAKEKEAAQAIAVAIFEGRPSIGRLTYATGWFEADERLEIVQRKKLEDAIRGIGAAPFLDHVREAHQLAGEILGITKGERTAPAKEPISELIGDLRDAISDYVVMVQAHALSGEPGAKALAHRLMAPIVSWQASAKRRPHKAVSELAPVAPAPAVVPAAATIPASTGPERP
jgi:hypothetical protein